jgi:alkanesulfonate monooxygenase
MLLRIFTEPQLGASYDTLLAVARTSESLGFDAFFRSDHYLTMGNATGLPGPSDAWITLAGLARDTSTIRLGTLVTSATFRNPGPLAITVAGVDAMAGGRVELGLGAGWYEDEHTAYGIPFPPVVERFERLEEQLAVVTGLWATPEGGSFTFEGQHYRLVDSPGLPKPVQRPGPPVIVGGHGAKRTPRLAATYAAEFNLAFSSLAETRSQFERVGAACEAAGRDPASLAYSAAQVVCCGTTEAEVAARARAMGRDVDGLRTSGLCGSPDEVVAKLATYAEAGAQRIYLQILDLADLDHLALIAESVLPHCASL